MLIITAWTKAVSDTKVIASGIITFINILIWYYVLQAIVQDINNWGLAVIYALGCSLGTVLATAFFRLQETKNKKIGWLIKLKNRLPW